MSTKDIHENNEPATPLGLGSSVGLGADRDGFGALIREAEATPEGRAELAEGQRWVYEHFYRDGPRPMLWSAYSDHLMGWMVYRQMPASTVAHEEAGPFKSRDDAERVLGPLLAQLEAPNTELSGA